MLLPSEQMGLTLMDTSLEWGNQVIDFGDHDPVFKVTWSNLTKCLPAPYHMNSDQTWLIV